MSVASSVAFAVFASLIDNLPIFRNHCKDDSISTQMIVASETPGYIIYRVNLLACHGVLFLFHSNLW